MTEYLLKSSSRHVGKRRRRRGVSTLVVILIFIICLSLYSYQFFSAYPATQQNQSDSSTAITSLEPASSSHQICPSGRVLKKHLDTITRSGHCRRLKRICWSRGALVVSARNLNQTRTLLQDGSFHPYISPSSPSRLQSILDSFPDYEKAIPGIPVHAHHAGEQPALDAYSTCTLPLVVYPYYPFDSGHSMQRVGSWLHSVTSQLKGTSLENHLEIVMHIPEGLNLPSHFSELLQPLVQQPVQSLQAASSREKKASDACYQDMLVCFGNEVINVPQYGQFLAQHYSSTASPPRATKKGTLEVVFDAGTGADSQIVNLDDLLAACDGSTVHSVTLVCSTVDISGVTSAAQKLSNADILIALHSSRLSHGFLLKPGASVIEVLPLGLKRTAPFAEQAAAAAADVESKLLWWHLFVCDPDSSVPGDHEVQGLKPKWTWSLYRSVKLSWAALEAVLEQVVAVQGNGRRYEELYQSNSHSFYMINADEKARQGTNDDSRDQCAVGSDPEKGSGVKIDNLSGLPIMWEVPPYPQGIIFLFNGGARKNSEWWDPQEACPDCLGRFEHVAIKNAALRRNLAVIAPYPDRGTAEFETWEHVRHPRSRDMWDDREDPVKSVDVPHLLSALDTIVKKEGLEGLPVFASGFSSGGRFAWMLPTVMKLRGIYPIAVYATQEWLDKWLRMVTYPPMVVMQMRNAMIISPETLFDGEPGGLNLTLQNVDTMQAHGVPVAAVVVEKFQVTVGNIQRFLGVNVSVAQGVFADFAELMDAKGFYIEKNGYPQKNMTTKMRLATIGRNNKVSQHKVVEMAWWFIGSHYIYADRADEIFAWLMDGGVTNFETQPLINFQRIVTES